MEKTYSPPMRVVQGMVNTHRHRNTLVAKKINSSPISVHGSDSTIPDPDFGHGLVQDILDDMDTCADAPGNDNTGGDDMPALQEAGEGGDQRLEDLFEDNLNDDHNFRSSLIAHGGSETTETDAEGGDESARASSPVSGHDGRY